MPVGSTTYNCICCGNESFSIPYDYIFRVIECSSCKYGIVDPIPNSEELDALYNSKEYFASHMSYDYDVLKDEEILRLEKEVYDLHIKHLKPFLGQGKSILEIGPGGGFTLSAFRKAGYNVKGVETSVSSYRFAKEKMGLDVENLPLEKFTTKDAFDVVMLNHVLEHFIDIHLAMTLLSSLVKKDGLLYVRVPDHDSYDRKSFGKNWPAYLPFHISYFSEASLKKFFIKYGFSVLKTETYISERFMKGFPSPLKSMLKKVVRLAGMEKRFNGRTITIIGKKL